jgi:predicted nuclease of predicted toxin-antitoxin system
VCDRTVCAQLKDFKRTFLLIGLWLPPRVFWICAGNIKPKDAIHVATALDAAVFALETFDDGLINKSGKIGNPSLIIRKPLAPAQGGLFDG